jgi:transmembrane sensor
MSTENRSLSRHVSPALSEARLARQFGVIAQRLDEKPRARAWPFAATLAGVVLACAVALVIARPWAARASGVAEGAVLESGPASEGAKVTFADGSEVTLERASRARVVLDRADAVRLEIERGGVEIEATHVAGRSFVVAARGYEVKVVGTHFEVRASPDAVEVHVDRGKVEIRSPSGDVSTLGAGETWRAGKAEASSPSASLSVSAPPPPPSPPPPPPSANAATSAELAQTAAPVDVDAPSSAKPSLQRGARDGAKELFEDARTELTAGHPAAAARAFDRLRREHRGDSRAGLAAYELGRLRLDALGDPRGAEEALRDAMTHGGPFREDAEARRVQALARMGDHGACTAARDAYLARYPHGSFRAAVSLYCGGT